MRPEDEEYSVDYNLFSSYGAGELGSEQQFIHRDLWTKKSLQAPGKDTREGSIVSSDYLVHEEPTVPNGNEYKTYRSLLWNVRVICICMLQLGASVQSLVFLSILLPNQVIALVGNERKGSYMGLLMLSGGVVSLISPPFIGIWSDRLKSRFGRRRPFIIVGTIVNCTALLAMGFSDGNYGLLVVSYLFIIVGSNIVQTVFNAAVFSMVPKRQLGTASGVIGALQILGFGIGTALGSMVEPYGEAATYGVLCFIVSITSLITLLTFHEERSDFVSVEDVEELNEMSGVKARVKSGLQLFGQAFVTPFQLADFKWVFLSRLFIQMGVYTVQEFLLFWVKDVIPIPNMSITTETAVLFAPIGLTSFIAALSIGRVSDYLGGRRKVFLFWACVLMGVLTLGLAITTSYVAALVILSFFGFGAGVFLALDYAVVCDVIPDDDNVACNLGVWHISVILPQLFVSPFAGIILDEFQQIGAHNGVHNLGYVVLFVLTSLYFAIAAVLFQQLTTVK